MPASSDSLPEAPPGPHATPPRILLRSLMPALDRAFGLEADPDLPEELAALVARLQGRPGDAAAEGSVPGSPEDAPLRSEPVAA